MTKPALHEEDNAVEDAKLIETASYAVASNLKT
jgi:hypothetical protein